MATQLSTVVWLLIAALQKMNTNPLTANVATIYLTQFEQEVNNKRND